MSRVGFISIVLLLMLASSLGYYTRGYTSSYGSRYSYPRTSYGRTYGSGYGSAYKTSYNAVSKAPLCKANGKIMLRLYVEDDGKPVSDAKVNYVDSKLIDTVSTDLYGYVAIPVYGCTVALIVYHKLDNPVFKTVDLLSCTTREEKVVIKLEAKCNFNIYFENTGRGAGTSTTDCTKCGDENQLVSYIYKSDDHTGSGQAVAGNPACITAGDVGDMLMLVLETQYANIFNVLKITITDNRYAVVSLPPQLVDDSDNTFDQPKYDFIVNSNTFEDDDKILNRIRRWAIIPKRGLANFIQSDAGTYTDMSSIGVEVGTLKDDKWLLAVLFHTSRNSDFTDVDLEGNVVVIDYYGNYQSVEHPDNGDDYDEAKWFLVGCFCKNVPSMKEGDFIPIGKYVTDDGDAAGDVTDITVDPYATHCNSLCVNNP